MTNHNAVLICPSGNRALVTLTFVNGQACADIGWQNYPPSDKDLESCNEVLKAACEVLTGEVYESGPIFTDKQQWERARRQFLGGGQG